MPIQTNNAVTELSGQDYVPVVKDTVTYYGGSQMWFSEKDKHSKDYILRNYGCGTIATADLFLYLARQNEAFRSPETMIALDAADSINYINYESYVRLINDRYTKTRRFIAVLGPRIAAAVNDYSKSYGLGYHAEWKWTLSYYDMYDIISEMLSNDIPVILSIGPNTPKLWGKKGIPFYQRYEVQVPVSITNTPADSGKAPEAMTGASGHPKETSEASAKGQEAPAPLPASSSVSSAANAQKTTVIVRLFRYRPIVENINSHYVTVTGIIKDDIAKAILLRISSWGSQYYIKYEEYRDYIENVGGTFTSSVVYIKKEPN